MYDTIRTIADRIEHGSLSGEKEILLALEDALHERPQYTHLADFLFVSVLIVSVTFGFIIGLIIGLWIG